MFGLKPIAAKMQVILLEAVFNPPLPVEDQGD